jgi:hypothetical protein
MNDFFGECDKKDGKIVNTNPLWGKEKVISDMEESVAVIERQEEEGLIVGGAKSRAQKRARKEKLKKTLSQISDSNPVGKIKGKELDDVRTTVDSLIEEIRDKTPTQHEDDMAIKSGRSSVNPTKQGFYSKRPCIALKNETELALAKKCGMVIENNMVSKDDATRGVWLMQKILGERPNHNQLKRDKPIGHVNRSSQVSIPPLPPGMGNKSKNRPISQG